MGSKGDAFENSINNLIFCNVNIANVGDGTGLQGSGTPGSFYVRLYTSAVAVNDSTIGTECAYTGYVQYGVSVARSSSGWSIASANVQNTSAITFGQCSAGSETIRYAALWKDNSNTTDAYRLYWGQLTSDLAVSSGITPEFAAGAFQVNED